jgi:hypothetical protein
LNVTVPPALTGSGESEAELIVGATFGLTVSVPEIDVDEQVFEASQANA